MDSASSAKSSFSLFPKVIIVSLGLNILLTSIIAPIYIQEIEAKYSSETITLLLALFSPLLILAPFLDSPGHRRFFLFFLNPLGLLALFLLITPVNILLLFFKGLSLTILLSHVFYFLTLFYISRREESLGASHLYPLKKDALPGQVPQIIFYLKSARYFLLFLFWLFFLSGLFFYIQRPKISNQIDLTGYSLLGLLIWLFFFYTGVFGPAEIWLKNEPVVNPLAQIRLLKKRIPLLCLLLFIFILIYTYLSV